MAQVTEEDLEQKRAKVEKLREQLASTEAKASTALQDQNNVIQGAALDAETAKLEARLNAAKEAAKVSNIKGGSEDLVANLNAAKEAAAADEKDKG